LALPARKFYAALAYNGIISLGEGRNKLIRIGAFGRLYNFFFACVQLAVSDIFYNGTAKKQYILRNDGHLVADIG
jgi:hypothetical protein